MPSNLSMAAWITSEGVTFANAHFLSDLSKNALSEHKSGMLAERR